jgi:hypothetical protein
MHMLQLSVVLHYAHGHGLRDPGVGGQEDVVEHLVGGSPFAVRASGMLVLAGLFRYMVRDRTLLICDRSLLICYRSLLICERSLL